MQDRRAEERFRSKGYVDVFTDGAEPLPAKVIDISPSRICLEVPVPLASGTIVRLESHSMNGEGTVHNCRVNQDRYWIGVALSPDSVS